MLREIYRLLCKILYNKGKPAQRRLSSREGKLVLINLSE